MKVFSLLDNIINKEKRVEGEKPGFFSSKGISPLVAAVLLIAITMAIAGLMATFATSISTEKLLEAKRCSPTLTLLDLEFKGGNITTRIANNNRNVAMEKITLSIIYDDATKNKENIALNTYAPKDSLDPLERMTVIIPTNDTTKPKKFEIVSETCSQILIAGIF